MKNFITLNVISLFLLFIVSCDKESTTVKITISTDKEFIIGDGVETITFTVTTEEGLDVTANCTFKVNGEAIATNSCQSTVIGKSNCVAEYETVESNKVKFNVKELPIFVKNILVENYTAVWCGYCPRVHDAIIYALGKSENVIPVAIHGSSDPFYFTSINGLKNTFGVEGYPTAMIDRYYSWPYPEEYLGLNTALNSNAALGLAITSEISGDDIIANVKVKFGKTFTNDLKIVVCLVESDLIADQTNYYNDGRGDPIKDYEHDNVLRKFETDLFGDAIPSAETTKDTEYTKTYTFSAGSYVKDKCTIIAYVVNSNKKALNTQDVIVPGSQDYQLLP